MAKLFWANNVDYRPRIFGVTSLKMMSLKVTSLSDARKINLSITNSSQQKIRSLSQCIHKRKCFKNEIELRSPLFWLRVFTTFRSGGHDSSIFGSIEIDIFPHSAKSFTVLFSQTFSSIVLHNNTICIIGGFEGFGFRLIFYPVIFGLCSVKDVILLYHVVTISFRICLFGAIRNPWSELGKIFYPR